MKKNTVKIAAVVIVMAMLFISFPALANDQPILPSSEDWTISEDEYAKIYNERNYEHEFMPGEVLVGMKCGINEAGTDESARFLFPELNITQIENVHESMVGTIRSKEIRLVYLITLAQIDRDSVIDAIQLLRLNSYVAFAEPNYIYSPAATPNDTYYYNLQNMNKIEAPNAWDITTGSSDVVVGILDSGIDHTHSDLAANIDMSRAYNAKDKISGPTANVVDFKGHGTHIAGVIGASGNNNNGVVGVNWNVTMIPVRICISNANPDTDPGILLAAFDYAENEGIPIVNLSYGIDVYNIALLDAISGYSGLVVIAAGNTGSNLNGDLMFEPLSKMSNVITVAMSKQNDTLHNNSNYGFFTVALAAPGDTVYSTQPGNRYGNLTGTSVAAAHVSGAAALLLSIEPNLTPQEIKTAILDSVDTFSALYYDVSTRGRLNVYNMLSLYPQTHTVHGYIWPFAVDYFGIGPSFTTLFDIVVELRPTFLTPAAPGLSIIAQYSQRVGAIAEGEFTFNDVTPGDYVLVIERPGFLVRCMNVTIPPSFPYKIELTPPNTDPNDQGRFMLWWGDCNGDRVVDDDDRTMILDLWDKSINDSEYDPACDLDASVKIDNDDLALLLSNWHKLASQYAGAGTVDFLS